MVRWIGGVFAEVSDLNRINREFKDSKGRAAEIQQVVTAAFRVQLHLRSTYAEFRE